MRHRSCKVSQVYFLCGKLFLWSWPVPIRLPIVMISASLKEGYGKKLF